ncbi:tetratricopeptide repeat protein [Saccharopolyspora sp. HNM0986]|uniref:AfsR/SARP family transcriptional regulator n=1 Tax=Saccharopolyspora galaxeae TaxID=2781241 RepID=UPI00190C025E|nr:BTAD domain-containing putative transcriptional regulator [Saccharopolyspora sp. HNM0986]MBK0865660.1 tetratricopeptide repeat protein [Saccharopolyspora sp. HNM0986]
MPGQDASLGGGGSGFTFRVLGPLEVRLDGVPLRVGSAAARGALACLLLEPNHVVPMDRLIDILWGEAPPATARTIVHGYIARIRRMLEQQHEDEPGRPAVLTRSPGYLLRVDNDRIDAHRARTLVNQAHGLEPANRAKLLNEALDLWRGPVLSDVGAERLHQMVGPNLDELRLLALEERISADLELGKHHRLVVELANLVDEHPLRERLTYLLMLAAYRAGNRAEAQASYHALRQRLSGELGIDPGPEVRTLYERLLRDDETLLGGVRPSTGRDSAPIRPVPAELPPAVAGFVGRESELGVLDRMLAERDRGGATMLGVLTGTAGVGKSAVAITWAHRVAGSFPEGQLYASLRGFDSERAPLSPGEALTSMLKALGVAADAIPLDVDDRAALYRSLLADRRVLVLLDNARDSDQVRPLLPGSSTALVLVTSRRRLDGLVVRSGARVLPLETLPTGSAVALLDRAGGTEGSAAEPDAARELAELCGGLPLALRIAAARLAANPARGVADLVHELTDESNRLHGLDIDDADTSVRRAFDISYRNLHPVHASTFRLLGLVPGQTFTAQAVAALCETDSAGAYRRLRALALAHLVTETEPDRFGMHDLLRLYARELLNTPEERTGERDGGALQRLLHYYLVVSDHARRFLRPARDDVDFSGDSTFEQPAIRNRTEALAWFDAEWPNLVAAVRTAKAQGLHQHAWQLVRCQFNYLVVRCPWEDWIQVYGDGLESARLAADPIGQVLMPAGLGVAYARSGRHEEALVHYAESYRCAVATGSPSWLAMAQVNMGAVLFRMQRYAEAQVHCRDALRVYRTLGDRYREAGALNNLAQVEQAGGHLAEALEHLLEAVVMYREADDLETLSMVLNNCGEVSIELGRLADGENYHHEALDVAQRCGSAMHQASAYLGLGDAAHARGDRSVAQTRWETALSIYETSGSPRAEQARSRLDSL